jgi:hypothetical protein
MAFMDTADEVMSVELSEDEIRFLETNIYPLVNERNRRLDAILRGWALLVEEIEAGQSLDTYSYENDLYFREVINHLINEGPASLVKKVVIEVEELDKRFIDATWEVDQPIYPNGPHTDWWIFRIPRKLEPDTYFRKDIEWRFGDQMMKQGIRYDD